MWLRALSLLTLCGLSLGITPLLSTSDGVVIIPPPSLPGRRIVYVAAMFGLHANEDGQTCGLVQTAGIQSLMAFKYAIEKAQRSVNGVNLDFALGGIVFDSCNSPARLMQNVMNFESWTIGYHSMAGSPIVQPSHTLGYVGPEEKYLDSVSDLLASFQKTQVATAASDSKYTDREKYPYLLRTFPDDYHYLQAIVDLLMRLNISTVQVVHTSSEHSHSSREIFAKLAEKEKICVEKYVQVPQDNEKADAEYDKAVDELMERLTVRTVVMLVDRQASDKTPQQIAIGNAVKRRQALNMFYFIVSPDRVGDSLTHLNGQERVLEGSILVNPLSDKTEEFANYFRNLKPGGLPAPFQHWWMKNFNCDLPGTNQRPNTCDVTIQSLASVIVGPNTGFIVDAVYSIVDGIKAASDKKCFGRVAICDEFLQSADRMFLVNDEIRKTKVAPRFSATGGPTLAKYEYMNYRKSVNAGHNIVKIGSWSQRDGSKPEVQVDAKEVHVYDFRGNLIRMESTCLPGQCVTCAPPPTKPPIVVVTDANATDDPFTTETPTGPFLRVRQEPWIIILIVLAGLGLFFTISFEVYLLSKLIGTRTVKHIRTMWLGQVLLIGIFLSYLLLFAFVPSPTAATCGLIRFGIGSCYAIMYAVLLVKLMTILNGEGIGYLEGIYQFLMFLFAWAIQLVIDTEWLIIDPPAAIWSAEQSQWFCSYSYLQHIQSLVYVMFLILICAIIAARANGIVTNQREAIFIGLAAGFSIPIWVAWTLVGSLNTNPDFHEPTLAFGLLLNTTLILFVMFLPKVYQLRTMGFEDPFAVNDMDGKSAAYASNYAPVASMYGMNMNQAPVGSLYGMSGNQVPVTSVYGGEVPGYELYDNVKRGEKESNQSVQLASGEQALFDGQQSHYVRRSGNGDPGYAYHGNNARGRSLRMSGAMSDTTYRSTTSRGGSLRGSGSLYGSVKSYKAASEMGAL